MAHATQNLDLGTGVYSLAEAARIVGRSVGQASSRQVRYWVHEGFGEPVIVSGSQLLSFQDLVSIEMVSRFRRKGVSLQAIKMAEQRIRARHPQLRQPFANLVFYTDGKNLWTLGGEDADRQVIELFGRTNQYAWRKAIETFAAEITFADGQAATWHPTKWVEINPRIQFGEPVVAGTRIPVRTVLANLEVGTPEDVAAWYGLSQAQVVGVRSYIDTAA